MLYYLANIQIRCQILHAYFYKEYEEIQVMVISNDTGKHLNTQMETAVANF